MEKTFKRIDWLGLVMLLVFCYTLSSVLLIQNNLVAYGALVTIFVIESIRAYYRGLMDGIDIIKGIRDEK